MFENIKNIFKRGKKRELLKSSSKDTAKERLHLVLMQDRANVSADFLDLMRQEIIEVIKKYIDIDEEAMDVRLGSETNEDGTQGAPALYANIPIINIKDETRKMSKTNQENHIIPKVSTTSEKEESETEKPEEEIKESKKETNEKKNEKDVKEQDDNKENKNEEKELKEEKTIEKDNENVKIEAKIDEKQTKKEKAENKEQIKKEKQKEEKEEKKNEE